MSTKDTKDTKARPYITVRFFVSFVSFVLMRR
jgi:hypothetical protein